MFDIVLLIHIVLAVALVGLIMIQQGKGADIGATFGSGSANTLFGSRGPASFMMKLTGGLMVLFFISSMALAHMSSSHKSSSDLVQQISQSQQAAAQVPAPEPSSGQSK